MIDLSYMPVLIEAHRNELRANFDRSHPPAQRGSRRHRLGTIIVRFGHWVENQCSEVASESSLHPSSQQACA